MHACIVDCAQESCRTDGTCDDPEHYFEYIHGHPSKEGMRIIADYVLERCVAWVTEYGSKKDKFVDMTKSPNVITDSVS
ncbi:hypothetical protein C8Q74DRAFT_1282382 [Fomes fomentarius]|nr:hypothetical protein C8Q74DRAFT_1282382 [Fomes fomentarius]